MTGRRAVSLHRDCVLVLNPQHYIRFCPFEQILQVKKDVSSDEGFLSADLDPFYAHLELFDETITWYYIHIVIT